MEEWRSSHILRRRLPEELWEAAVGVARQEGVYRTARALRLDYTNLKRRIETTAGKEAIAALDDAPYGAANCNLHA